MRQPIAYSGRVVLADWWCWSGRIAEERSRLARINKAKMSRNLYGIRQRRFRHAVNAMIKTIVEEAYALGITEMVVGDLKGIRENSHSSKANAMINNFWGFNYIFRRIKEKAEERGIKVVEASECRTSSIRPFCNAEGERARRGLFRCRKCCKALHADVVGALNMARKAIIPYGGIKGSWRSHRF